MLLPSLSHIPSDKCDSASSFNWLCGTEPFCESDSCSSGQEIARGFMYAEDLTIGNYLELDE
jgi:hypothetical protein